MTAYTSTQTGPWSDAATWGGAGVPALGDTATNAAGFTVTCTVDAVIGADDISGVNGYINNGTTVINAGVNFTAHCDILLHGTTGSNGIFQCDGNFSFDGTTSGVKYKMIIGDSVGTTAKLITANNSGNRPSFTSAGSGHNGFLTVASLTSGCGRVELHFADISKIGDATNVNCNCFLADSAPQKFILDSCTIDSCGYFQIGTTMGDHATLTIQNNIFTNSAGSKSFQCPGAGGSTGPKLISNNYFDKPPQLLPITNVTIQLNTFADGYTMSSTMTGATFTYNFTDSKSSVTNGCPIETYGYYFDSSSNTNPHPYNLYAATVDFDMQFLIFDTPSGATGDMLTGGTTNRVVSVINTIMVPNAAGQSPGKLLSPTAVILSGSCNHNTMTSTIAQMSNGETGVANYGEGFPGFTNMFTSLKNNIIYSPTGKGVCLQRVNTSFVGDIISPANADYNAFNNPVTTATGGVDAVYGTHGGYTDVIINTRMQVRLEKSAGAFTLYCYASDGITFTETVSIAQNASSATVIAAISTALNANADGTYVVSDVSPAGGGVLQSSAGVLMTLTRNAVPVLYAQLIHTLLVGATNTTGGIVWTTCPMFSTTPTLMGNHDVIGEPRFVDPSRNFATFDTAYLGNVASAWSAGTSYTANAVVSSSDPSFFDGATINFYALSGNIAVQPGVTAGWQTYWQYAGLLRFKTSRPVYSAFVRQATTKDLLVWVAAGFSPTNPAYEASSDGQTIGASLYTAITSSGYFYSGG